MHGTKSHQVATTGLAPPKAVHNLPRTMCSISCHAMFTPISSAPRPHACVFISPPSCREEPEWSRHQALMFQSPRPSPPKDVPQGELLATPKDAVTLPQPALFSKHAQSRGPARLLDHQPSVEIQASLHSPPFTVKPDPQKAKISKTSMSTLGNMLLPTMLQQ